jgi:hypothetical protein
VATAATESSTRTRTSGGPAVALAAEGRPRQAQDVGALQRVAHCASGWSSQERPQTACSCRLPSSRALIARRRAQHPLRVVAAEPLHLLRQDRHVQRLRRAVGDEAVLQQEHQVAVAGRLLRSAPPRARTAPRRSPRPRRSPARRRTGRGRSPPPRASPPPRRPRTRGRRAPPGGTRRARRSPRRPPSAPAPRGNAPSRPRGTAAPGPRPAGPAGRPPCAPPPAPRPGRRAPDGSASGSRGSSPARPPRGRTPAPGR